MDVHCAQKQEFKELARANQWSQAVEQGAQGRLRELLRDDPSGAGYGLWPAARCGREDLLKMLLDWSDPSQCAYDPLEAAALGGHAGCVKLLAGRCDPKANNSKALALAARGGHGECVRILLPLSDAKANGSNALKEAVDGGHADCVALLLPSSDPLDRGVHGKSALEVARWKEQVGGSAEVAAMVEAFAEGQELGRVAREASKGKAPGL